MNKMSKKERKRAFYQAQDRRRRMEFWALSIGLAGMATTFFVAKCGAAFLTILWAIT